MFFLYTSTTNIPSMTSKFIFIFSFFSFYIVAQKIVTNQNLYWMRYYNQLEINEKFMWHNEMEIRRFFEGNVKHHFIAHTRMHYKTGQNTDVALGITYSRQSPQDPISTSNLIVPEFRGVQEFNYVIFISNRFTFQQRLRIEQRFIRNNNGIELLDGYGFNFRFRFRLQANYRISNEEAINRTTLKISNEIMVNAGKNIIYNQFDQNRIYIGIERDFSKSISFELGYINWYQQTVSGNHFFNRDIIRLTLYHRLKLK